MSYVDSFIVPVPKAKLPDYTALANLASQVWRDHGALNYREFIAEDVPVGEVTSFPRSVQLKDDEVVVVAYIDYASRAERDRVMAEVMKDPRMSDMNPSTMPFDGKRMIFGGFDPLVQLGGSTNANTHGHFNWNEFTTRDSERVKTFYSETLGWTYQNKPLDDGEPYWIALADGVPVAGIFSTNRPGLENVPEGWMSYIAVDDVDNRVARAVKLGAKLMRPIFDAPGVGRIAILTQPGGGAIGWITPTAMKRESAGSTPADG